MAEELEVIIGANTKGIEEGATRAERALNDIQKSIKRLERDIADNITISRGYKSAIDDLTRAYKAGDLTQDQYSQGIRRLQRDEKETQVETKRLTAEMRNLQREQKQLNATTPTLTKNTQAATKAGGRNAAMWTEVGRTLGDAQYGMMGMANNLQQIAFLAGASGGASIAITALTVAMTVFWDEILKVVGAQDELIKSTKEYVGEAVAEAAEVNRLVAVAKNHENSIVSRRRAIDELNEKYGDYLGNLSLEQIESDKTTAKVDNLTKALIRQAQVRGLEDRIGEIAGETGEALTELQITQREAFQSVQKELKAAAESGYWKYIIKDTNDVIGSLKAMQATGEELPSGLVQAVGLWRDTNEEIKKVQKNSEASLKPLTDLQTALEEQIFGSMNINNDAEEVIIDGLKKNPIRIPVTPVMGDLQGGTGDPRIQNSIRLQRELSNELALLKDAQSMLLPYSKEWDIVGEAIERTEDRLSGFTNSLKESGQRGAAELAKLGESGMFDQLNERFIETSELANIFASSVGTAISQLGNVMQEQLAESGKAIQILGGLLINTATQIISQLLKTAIQERLVSQISKRAEQTKAGAKGVTIATNAAAAAGPVGVALLPGLLASTQAMIQGAFAATEGFNFGGFVGDRNLVRMNGNERILTATEANTFNNLMQNRAVNTSQQRVAVDVHVEGGLSGENIHFSQVRYQQKQSRLS